MGWYAVTKKINGRAYLYRQRTWREGGKVKCQNVYLGPAGDYGKGGVWKLNVADKNDSDEGKIEIVDNTTPATPEEWLASDREMPEVQESVNNKLSKYKKVWKPYKPADKDTGNTTPNMPKTGRAFLNQLEKNEPTKYKKMKKEMLATRGHKHWEREAITVYNKMQRERPSHVMGDYNHILTTAYDAAKSAYGTKKQKEALRAFEDEEQRAIRQQALWDAMGLEY